MNIGDIIEYRNIYDEKRWGKIAEIGSAMDSYETMQLKDGVPFYYSKKLSRFVPVKDKNMDSVFLTVTSIGKDKLYGVDINYVMFNEVKIKIS
jgi:hypothetical protein|tara:strand:+ start:977 stop:1255 length:279 start_codon:yes stop_codon:yes gene_type:complete